MFGSIVLVYWVESFEGGCQGLLMGGRFQGLGHLAELMDGVLDSGRISFSIVSGVLFVCVLK